ncbi:MAG: GDSL-type esterase/lipase family protein [Candidatus Aminicenantes bacterium]|nr:GDSL-type esterase/lipase family protein [Candidatus Aminicenantes bacterium]
MKKTSLFLFLLILSISIFSGQHNKNQEGRKSAFPCFSNTGDLIFLFEQEGEGIFLGEQKIPWQNEIQKEKLLIKGNASSPTIKIDNQNRMWIAWQEEDLGRLDVYLACLEDGQLKYRNKISENFKGENTSPSLESDLNGNTWMTWINNNENHSRILVKDIKNGRTWQVNSSSISLAYTPRIAIDKTNIVWIFWVSQQNDQDVIFVSHFDGIDWSENSSLHKDSRYPHINPEVCLDIKGYPWIVWSAYDGKDYEIWYSYWNGREWSTETRITDNSGISDIYPHIAFLPGNLPLVAWSQMGIESHVFLVLREKGKWSQEIRIDSENGWNRKPRLAVSGFNIGIVWDNVTESKSYIRMKILTYPDLFQENSRKKTMRHFPARTHYPRKKTKVFTLNSDLNDEEYIAFGDSITYGVLSRTWFPDKGYVPRLEHLLRSHFSAPKVLNRGIPGEQTLEGLARIETVLTQDKSKNLLLMEGTNDMTGGIPSETTAFNIEEMIKKCIQFDVFPLIATIIPRSDILWSLGIRDRTLLFNKLLEKIVPAYSLPLVDQYGTFMDYPDGYLSLFSDGAHPNELGYELMAEAWFESIKKIPLPPVNLKAERKINKYLFYDEHINVVTWEANPLLFPEIQLANYQIFRKKDEESDKDFEMIATVPADTFVFLDRKVLPTQIYNYYIQAESIEGIRGPVSITTTDR